MNTTKKICSCSSCPSAGRPQAASKFGRNNTSADGLHWYCKWCNNQKQRDWKAANPDKVKEWKRRYVEKNKKKNAKLSEQRQGA